MTDIHCHILPFVDDGAYTIEDSLKMLICAMSNGTKSIVATPHSSYNLFGKEITKEDKLNAFIALQNLIKEKNLPIKLYLGEEIFYDETSLAKLKANEFFTMNGTKYVLIEFDFHSDFSLLQKSVSELISSGYYPIVAHPERYRCIYSDFENAYKLKELGAYLEINSTSILGYDRKKVYKASKFIIESGFADFVASDAHSPFSRTPDLSVVHEYLSVNYSMSLADKLIITNTQIMLSGEKI